MVSVSLYEASALAAAHPSFSEFAKTVLVNIGISCINKMSIWKMYTTENKF